jgi:hypothetical protein
LAFIFPAFIHPASRQYGTSVQSHKKVCDVQFDHEPFFGIEAHSNQCLFTTSQTHYKYVKVGGLDTRNLESCFNVGMVGVIKYLYPEWLSELFSFKTFQ